MTVVARPRRDLPANAASTRSSRLVTLSSQVAIRRPSLWMTGPQGQVCATGHEGRAAEGSRSHDTSVTGAVITGQPVAAPGALVLTAMACGVFTVVAFWKWSRTEL